MKNLYQLENVGYLVAKKLNVKFGLGSGTLIGILKNWFKNIFEIDDPIGCRLRKFEIMPIGNDEKCIILIILLEKEWGVFWELLEQFCFSYGFGVFEEEIKKNLKIWRKKRNEHCFSKDVLVKCQKNGVARILEIDHSIAKIILASGEEKECKIQELINIS